jgi:predicted MFS family arabinose efflux permease
MKAAVAKNLRVLLPFAFGYFLSYLYRVVNAVIAANLASELGVDPSQLGLLTAAYFLTFAAAQLPLGVLLDRFGPRVVESVLLLFAGMGAFVFAGAGSIAGLVVGRALIGFGVSACLMAAFKAFVIWFPAPQLPLINGIQMAAGGFGALTATAPVQASLRFTDWRGVFVFLGIVTLAAAAAIFLAVPKSRPSEAGNRLAEQVRGILQVFSSAVFWRIAPLTMMSQAAFMSIQGLWAGPWLRDVAGLAGMAVGDILLVTAAAMVAGFVILGALAERLSRVGVPPLVVAVLGMAVFMAVQLLIVLEVTAWVLPLWLLFGFTGTTGIIPYASLSQSFPAHLSGRVNTGLNLLVFVVAFAGQWGIGAIINLWPRTPGGGYAAPGYQAGFGMMLGLQTLALIWCVVAGLRLRKRSLSAA